MTFVKFMEIKYKIKLNGERLEFCKFLDYAEPKNFIILFARRLRPNGVDIRREYKLWRFTRTLKPLPADEQSNILSY